jgi:hypothetical protein
MSHHPAPFPLNEEERVLSLEDLDVLDSACEKAFDDIVLLGTTLCDAPIALVSLVDQGGGRRHGVGVGSGKGFCDQIGWAARINTAPGAATTVSVYLSILGCIATSEAV